MSQLQVVVVNWNAGGQLRDCVESVLRFGPQDRITIVVVDNGSSDGSDVSIEGWPNVTLIRNQENLGFAKACNLGAANSGSEFLLFLNPDACVFADTLSSALGFMAQKKYADVGICGIQLIDEYGHIARSCSRFPSAANLVIHALGVNRFFPRLGHLMAEWDHAATRRVDHVIGAFYLVRRTLFESLHGFDERFFVYLEDLDFSRRASELGWRTFYLAETQAFHAGGGTSAQVKAKRLFYSLRSRILYAFKHFNRIQAITVLLVTISMEPLFRSVDALRRFSWKSFRETCAAYMLLFRWLRNWAFLGTNQ